jgi:hypothetical protein
LGNILTSTSQKVYKNGNLLATNIVLQTVSQPTIRPLYILARNDAGLASNFSQRNLAFAHIGDGLTDTDATNYYNLVQAFQTALSRNI